MEEWMQMLSFYSHLTNVFIGESPTLFSKGHIFTDFHPRSECKIFLIYLLRNVYIINTENDMRQQ